MDPIVRLFKAVALTAITFAGVWYLSGNMTTALLVSLLPLIFILFGIFESFGSTIAALSMIAAVVAFSLPVETKSFIRQAIEELREQAAARPKADAPPEPAVPGQGSEAPANR